MITSPTRLFRAILAFILALPLLAILHELLVLAAAALLRGLVQIDGVHQFVRLFIASPVHAQLMLETIGGVYPRGLATGGLPGDFLRTLSPSIFLGPESIAPSAWSSAVVDGSSTVLGLFLAMAIAEALLIVVGSLFIRFGWRGQGWRDLLAQERVRYPLSVALGLFVQAQAISGLFRLTRSPLIPGLRDTGIGFALSLLLQMDAARYAWLMDQALPVLIPFIFVLIGYGLAWLVGRLLDRAIGIVRRLPRPLDPPSWKMRLARPMSLAVVLLPVVAFSSLSEGYLGLARTFLLARTVQVAEAQVQPRQPDPVPTPVAAVGPTRSPSSTPTAPRAPGISIPTPGAEKLMPRVALRPAFSPTAIAAAAHPPPRVGIRRLASGWRILVDGEPVVITGMNYNVNYVGLPDQVKRSRHHRDFKIMRDAGVNAVVGWGIYDEATLQVAHEYGIGVIMPFELDPRAPFEDQGYRDDIKNKFRLYVNRFKAYPAVWAWNPGGDELLHRMDTEQHRTVDKLQAAADFLVELSALAYSLDPNHVSVVKEPRDWYVPHLDVAIRKMRAQPQNPDPSSYLIFGVNVYGHPEGVSLAVQTARRNAEERLGIALVVGEFGPFGLARTDRPGDYAVIWNDVLRSSPNGGFAYVFGPDQPNPDAPNPYDPLRLLVNEFSLVDMDGNPVDGALAALSAQYHATRHPPAASSRLK